MIGALANTDANMDRWKVRYLAWQSFAQDAGVAGAESGKTRRRRDARSR